MEDLTLTGVWRFLPNNSLWHIARCLNYHPQSFRLKVFRTSKLVAETGRQSYIQVSPYYEYCIAMFDESSYLRPGNEYILARG
jgi:hypothetical protein